MSDENIVKIIQDASVDAQSLSEFMYKPADFMVERRLAPAVHTLEFYLQYLDRLPILINDKVDEVVLGSYKTNLESLISDLEIRITALENK